ncbi:MAG: iron-siderophore ABC transporter substrate-binding protein [Ectothiorhodospiraceae bacterium]
MRARQRGSIRRLLQGVALALFVLAAARSGASDDDAPRIATLDWTLAETLVALDVTPVAVAQVDAYHAWVGEPRLPDAVHDLGLRGQPNLERLATLEPDHILISPRFANLAPRLERIAPVTQMALYTGETAIWPAIRSLTRDVGAIANREAAADQLLTDTEARIRELGERLTPAERERPVAVIQFVDARHVRVFGAGSLFQGVIERLGLTNAWAGGTNAWGFQVVALERLADLDARLVVVRPFPEGVAAQLERPGLWQQLPSVRNGTTVTLPPIWSFGALPSARRFAEVLVAALTEDEG